MAKKQKNYGSARQKKIKASEAVLAKRLRAKNKKEVLQSQIRRLFEKGMPSAKIAIHLQIPSSVALTELRQMGLVPRVTDWTAEQLEILKREFPTCKDLRELAAKIGRPYMSVASKAAKTGLKRDEPELPLQPAVSEVIPDPDAHSELQLRIARHIRLSGPQSIDAIAGALSLEWFDVQDALVHRYFASEPDGWHLTAEARSILEERVPSR